MKKHNITKAKNHKINSINLNKNMINISNSYNLEY